MHRHSLFCDESIIKTKVTYKIWRKMAKCYFVKTKVMDIYLNKIFLWHWTVCFSKLMKSQRSLVAHLRSGVLLPLNLADLDISRSVIISRSWEWIKSSVLSLLLWVMNLCSELNVCSKARNVLGHGLLQNNGIVV